MQLSYLYASHLIYLPTKKPYASASCEIVMSRPIELKLSVMFLSLCVQAELARSRVWHFIREINIIIKGNKSSRIVYANYLHGKNRRTSTYSIDSSRLRTASQSGMLSFLRTLGILILGAG